MQKIKQLNVITHPCRTFNGGLSKPQLGLGMAGRLHPIQTINVITWPWPNLTFVMEMVCHLWHCGLHAMLYSERNRTTPSATPPACHFVPASWRPHLWLDLLGANNHHENCLCWPSSGESSRMDRRMVANFWNSFSEITKLSKYRCFTSKHNNSYNVCLTLCKLDHRVRYPLECSTL